MSEKVAHLQNNTATQFKHFRYDKNGKVSLKLFVGRKFEFL